MTSQNFTLLEEIKQRSERSPQKIALQIWENEQHRFLTYEQLYREFQALAQILSKRGIGSGDRIILVAESRRLEWVVAFLALQQLQATAVILDPSLEAADLCRLIEQSDARAALTVKSMYDALQAIQPLSLLCLDLEKACQALNEGPLRPASDPDPSIACILFTSGTIAEPKGAMLTHEGLFHVAAQGPKAIGFDSSFEVLGVIPLSHIYGLTYLLLPSLLFGATITFVEKIQGAEILQAMRRSKTTLLVAVPRLIELLYQQIFGAVEKRGRLAKSLFYTMLGFNKLLLRLGFKNQGRRLFKTLHQHFGGNLTKIASGAAPIDANILIDMQALGWEVFEGYGLTETCAAATCNTLSHTKLSTVGKPIANVQVRIENPNRSGEGKILVRGPSVMKGYFRNKAATEMALQEGWFDTGDIGKFDSEGYLQIVGRIKEMIVLAGGKKAMPSEVERRYQQIAGIEEIAVVGIRPAHQAGEEIHAAVVVQKDFRQGRSDEELYQHFSTAVAECSKNLPAHLRIQQLHIVDVLPKTTTLKVKRGVLREMIETNKLCETKRPAHQQSTVSLMKGDHQFERLQKLLFEEANKNLIRHFSQIQPSSSLQFDLSLDSLARMEVKAKIEKEFSVCIATDTLFSIDRVQDLWQLLNIGEVKKEDSSAATVSNEFSPHSHWMKDLTFQTFFSLSKTLWKHSVKGLENLPKAPFILAANHASHLDIFWIFSSLPKDARDHFVSFAKKELFEKKWLNSFLSMVNAIPTNRDGDTSTTIERGLWALKQGYNLFLHPEGTRTLSGQLNRFHRGAAHISLLTGTPLVPVAIIGSYEVYSPHHLAPKLFDWKKMRRFEIKIIIGEPIDVKGFAPTKENEAHLTHLLRQKIEQLLA